MKPHQVLIFILAALTALFSFTFLSSSGKGTESDGIDVFGLFDIKYPTAKKFLAFGEDIKRVDKDTLLESVDTGTEDELDDMIDAMTDPFDSTYNNQDSSLTGLQIPKVGDIEEVLKNVRRIEFPNEDRSLFFPLFQKLEGISARQSTVRGMHYGDSQIEGDRITAFVRDKMQRLFGGNGPGFIPLMPVYNQQTVVVSNEGSWSRHAVFGPASQKLSHNRYGAFMSVTRFTPELPDSMITDTLPEATASVTIGKSNRTYANAQAFNVIKVHYGNCVKRTSIKVFNDGEQIVFDSLVTDGGYHTYDIRLGATPTNLKIEFSGIYSPDFYGLTLDGNYGFTMDNIAMRGSSGTVFGKINFSEFSTTLNNMQVEFVIMEFGGNLMPYLEDEEQAARNARWFQSQINTVKRARPNAQILVIGPSDMSVKIDGEYQTYPLMEFYIDEMKKAAFGAGAAYWDMYRAMGGENSMIVWVEDFEWAGPDYTHFSPAGARKIATQLFQALLLEYKHYQTQNAGG